MAKALKKKQPYSSVDRFFSGASLQDALAPQAVEHPPAPKDELEGASMAPQVATEADAARSPESPAPKSTPAVTAPMVQQSAEAPAHITRANEVAEQRPASRTMRIVPPRAESQAIRTAEPVDRQREFQLTRTTDETLEDLILVYKRATGAEVTRSHVLRAILKGIAERMPELKREAQAIGPLRRPSNAKGFEEAREEFEDQIKEAFLKGIS